MATSAVNIKPTSDMMNSLMELSLDKNSASCGNMSDAGNDIRSSEDAPGLSVERPPKIGITCSSSGYTGKDDNV